MIWDNYKRIACFPEKCSCEPKHLDSFIVQPFAAFTSLPFIVLGIYLYKKTTSFHLRVLTSLFIFLGFSSLFLHISLLDLANYFDFGSIFAIFSWMVAFFTTKRNEHAQFIYKIFSLTLIWTSTLYFFPAHPAYFFTLYFLITLFIVFKKLQTTILSNKQKSNLIKSVLLVITGSICFVLDEARIYCFEHFFIYGHALWHLFVVVAMYYQYRFFSELILNTKEVSHDSSGPQSNQETDIFIPS